MHHPEIKQTETRWPLIILRDWLFLHQDWLISTLLIFLTILLLLANLESYPTISGWDEGMYLEFAHNLIYHGEYATRNGDIFERLIPVGGTGPTLIAPVGLALWLSNNSLLAARMVIFVYSLMALLGLYLITYRIGGRFAAIASIPLFLTAGYTSYDTLWMGRQVLAETPAFAFMLFGLWLWFKSWQGSLRGLLVSGLLLGLAVITKNQFIWVLGPTFALLVLADLLYYRQLTWLQRLAPLVGIGVGYGAWLLVSLWLVGSANRADYLETQSYLMATTFLHVGPERWVANLKFLYQSGQWLIFFVAVAYALFRSRPRTRQGLQLLTLPLFAGMAMLSFVALSLPWARYLYPPLALGALCSALLLSDLTRWATLRWKLGSLQAAALLALFLILLTGPRLIQNGQRIATTHDNSAARFATLVDEQTAPGSDVLNWEWEIEFYSQRPFRHPPYELFPAMIDQVYNQRTSPLLEEPRLPEEIEYVIVGPFADEIEVFDAALEQRPHRLILSEGPYQLYQLE